MSNPFIGEIRMFGGNFAPAGWAFCNGQLMPISENESLFILIGTTYGGDGESTFALPNLQSRFPVHQGSGPGGQTFTLGEMAGTEQETLTVNQIPTHSHAFLATTALANQPTPGNNVPAQSGTVQLYVEAPPALVMGANAIQPIGGSQPHDNMHPFLVINFIISLFGEFPTQT
jgi:microcystin-dependent protein